MESATRKRRAPRHLASVLAAFALITGMLVAASSAAFASSTCGGKAPTQPEGTAGDDTIVGTAGDDVLIGGDGNDTINSLGGNDTICGGLGNDVIAPGDGNDTIYGDTGILDVVVFADATGNIAADLSTGQATGAGTDQLSGVEGIVGSSQADTLTGDAATYNVFFGMGGNDTIHGGPAFDLVGFLQPTVGIKASLLKGTAKGEGSDHFDGMEGLIGSDLNDTLTGGYGDDVLTGQGGDDVLKGGSGYDTLLGNDGNDSLSGGDQGDILMGEAGTDLLSGGPGQDIASYSDAPQSITASLVTKTATGDGSDTLSGVESLEGSSYADVLEGNGSANHLAGSGGDDRISALGGNDGLDGGLGSDIGNGGAGTDVCLSVEAPTKCETLGDPQTATAGMGATTRGSVAGLPTARTAPAPPRAAPNTGANMAAAAFVPRDYGFTGICDLGYTELHFGEPYTQPPFMQVEAPDDLSLLRLPGAWKVEVTPTLYWWDGSSWHLAASRPTLATYLAPQTALGSIFDPFPSLTNSWFGGTGDRSGVARPEIDYFGGYPNGHVYYGIWLTIYWYDSNGSLIYYDYQWDYSVTGATSNMWCLGK